MALSTCRADCVSGTSRWRALQYTPASRCSTMCHSVRVHSGLEVTKVQTEPEEWTGDGAFRFFLSGAALNGGGFFGGNFGGGNGTVPGGNTSQQRDGVDEVVGAVGF